MHFVSVSTPLIYHILSFYRRTSYDQSRIVSNTRYRPILPANESFSLTALCTQYYGLGREAAFDNTLNFKRTLVESNWATRTMAFTAYKVKGCWAWWISLSNRSYECRFLWRRISLWVIWALTCTKSFRKDGRSWYRYAACLLFLWFIPL